MKRRDFLTLLGAAAASPLLRPLAARAQPTGMPVIGYLHPGSPALEVARLRAFLQGLNDTGYVEGRDVAIEYRWAEDHYDRLPALAADLVQRQVAVIVAGGGPPALAAKVATKTIPVVFYHGGDPVELGLVASLSRPGGNLTGVTALTVELTSKRLEVMRELVPSATEIALLVNPANSNADALSRDVQAAGRTLGLQIHVLRASTERDFETVFATLGQLRAGGLVIGGDPFLNAQIGQLAALALRHAVPAIYARREFPLAGGLMSYGDSSITELYRLVGVYTGRILKGEKPADLPVQQSTKIELVINLKTAKAFGITVPLSLLGRADEVIE